MFRFRSQFVTNIVSNMGGNSVNSVLQLVLLLALSRFLNTSTYAAYLTASALIGIAEIASDFGTKMWATRRFSGGTDINHTFRQCLAAKLFYTLMTLLVLSVLPLNLPAVTTLVILTAVAATQPATDPFLWFLRSQDRLDVEAALVLVYRLVQAVALFVAAYVGTNLQTMLLIWLACNVGRMVAEGAVVSRSLSAMEIAAERWSSSR